MYSNIVLELAIIWVLSGWSMQMRRIIRIFLIGITPHGPTTSQGTRQRFQKTPLKQPSNNLETLCLHTIRHKTICDTKITGRNITIIAQNPISVPPHRPLYLGNRAFTRIRSRVTSDTNQQGAIGGTEAVQTVYSHKRVSSSLRTSITRLPVTTTTISPRKALRNKRNNRSWIGETLSSCPTLFIWTT